GLEHPGPALSAADAHRDEAVALLAAEHLVGQRAGQPRAGHTERMPDRDRAAVDVEPLGIDAEPVAAVDHLDGERLVQLPEIDVLDLETVPPEELRHREDRADPHLVGLAARHGEAAEDRERLDA